MKSQQIAMFESGEDTPLFTGMPVLVNEPAMAPPRESGAQPMLLQPKCAFCMDAGFVMVNGIRRTCWCQGGSA